MKMRVAGRWLVVVLAIAPSALPAPDGVAAPPHRADRPSVAQSAVDSESLSDLPLAAQAQVSAVLGRDQSSYHAVPHAGGLRVENSRHGLTADFTPAAVRVRAGMASWGLSLVGYGYSDAPRAATAVAPRAVANRVEYRRGDLTEWYLNGPLGLEQGFTLAKAPGKSTGAPLTLAFKLSGNLIASADAKGKNANLSRADGTAALRYRGLTAHDAAGRELRSWLQVEGERLMLRVDDTGARYPLVVDPFIEQARLTASDGADFDEFGNVAVDGDTIVVGAYLDDIGANTDQGSAYVFVKPVGGWSGPLNEQARLIASDGAAGDQFGISVAVSADTIVVGARWDDISGKVDQGSAYVFVKPPGGWSGTPPQSAKLTASAAVASASDWFGEAVAISGDTIVVGARLDDIPFCSPACLDLGRAYVFVKPTAGWSDRNQNATLNPLFSSHDQFGVSVAIDGETIVVGAWLDGPSDRGRAYVFVKPVAGWSGDLFSNARLVFPDLEEDVLFGVSVGVSGDTIVVGAYLDNIGANTDQGSAYVFVKPVGGWTTTTPNAKLTASDGAAFDLFGERVAISGDTVFVAAIRDNIGPNIDQGSVYTFVKPATGWNRPPNAPLTENEKLTASDGAALDQFGILGVSGNTLVVGARGDDVGVYINHGSAYVFTDPHPATVTLTPESAENPVGTSHTVTAAVEDENGQPVEDVIVRFAVTGTVTESGSCTTSASGECDFSYLGPTVPGDDDITAFADTDGDGVQDADEPAGVATKTWVAVDQDGDGVPDASDNCPAVANADQTDSDGDGPGDACDACPNDALNDADDDDVCGDVDNCPAVANADQANGDGDALGDACDACPGDAANDADGDGVCGDVDNCPAAANADQANADGDTLGDACDACPADPANDADGDGVCGNVDNCPTTPNAGQADGDVDGQGDACDACPADPANDADGDGVCGNVDNCPAAANADQANADGDALGDACDACPADPANDADGDGACGNVDNCPSVANTDQANGDGDALGDACDACRFDAANDGDTDGVCGDVDNCPFVGNPDQVDIDGDGFGDACDPFFNFGFRGLLPPYAAPPKRFKGNRTIPLKWQYTGADGSVVGSADADPTVSVQGPVPCGETTDGELLDVSAAGDSGYQYDGDTGTWHFNWQTGGVPSGCYYIQVTSAQAQPSPLFPIQLE